MDRSERVAEEMWRAQRPNGIATGDIIPILRRKFAAVQREAYQAARDLMDETREAFPLTLNHAEDGRYTWPQRWDALETRLNIRARAKEET